ncbi:hypothetical protein D3C84_1132220 [compost metagenome]
MADIIKVVISVMLNLQLEPEVLILIPLRIVTIMEVIFIRATMKNDLTIRGLKWGRGIKQVFLLPIFKVGI